MSSCKFHSPLCLFSSGYCCLWFLCCCSTIYSQWTDSAEIKYTLLPVHEREKHPEIECLIQQMSKIASSHCYTVALITVLSCASAIGSGKSVIYMKMSHIISQALLYIYLKTDWSVDETCVVTDYKLGRPVWIDSWLLFNCTAWRRHSLHPYFKHQQVTSWRESLC